MKKTSFDNILNACLNLVYPPRCFLCQQKISHLLDILCPSCQKRITLNTPPFCKKCSRHLELSHPQKICPQCRKHKPDFDKAWGAAIYNEPLRRLLHLFKYQKKTIIRHLFADILYSFVDRHKIPLHSFDFLIPMPIHPTKHREREFNQTELIASLLSKKFQIPINTNNLIRKKNTPPQAFLEEKERWTNVHDAFRIRKPLELKNRSILIIDDLLTTGATACEAAKTCKQNGAKKVSVLTLAIGQ